MWYNRFVKSAHPSACPTYRGNCRSRPVGITDSNPVGKEGALRTVPGLRPLRPTPTNSSHFSPPLSRRQLTPLTSLAATLMSLPRKCCKHKTYGKAKSFRCNTYKNPGVRECPRKSWKTCASWPRGVAFLLKFFPFTLLRTLLHSPKTQLFCFQAIPHSLRKTTGGGVSL